ncbi:hypothetical protein BG452_03345 [Streptomyces sp. CBMA123]|nr:hypothetical protein [Streptomyces sp. CBMA123]
MLQPGEDGLQGELVQGTDAAVDDEPAVADVEVVELEAADRAGPGGVDGCEGEDQPVAALPCPPGANWRCPPRTPT